MSQQMPPTTSNLLLSLENIGNYIERRYHKHLQFPAQGIYKVGDTAPTLVNGNRYYVLNINDKTNTKKILEDINTLQSGDYVIDINGQILLTQRDVENKFTYLLDKPTVPTVGFDLIKLFIEHHITNKNTFTNDSRNIKYSILRKINGEDNEDIFNEIDHDPYLQPIYSQVDYFVGKDIYYIYFLKRTGLSDLLVEKTIDWRAYQWEIANNITNNS